MSAEHDVIKKLIEHIDTAVTKHSVSNRHVATVLEYLLNNLSEVDLEKLTRFFLRKDKDDSTNFLVKFLKGAEFGEYYSINEIGEAILRSLKLGNFGISELGAAIFSSLKLGQYGITEAGVATLSKVFANIFQSSSFSTGALGNGFTIKVKEDGNSYIEVDELFVRKIMTVLKLIIQELKHVGGQIILTPASMECSRVEEFGSYYRCYFNQEDQSGKEINNQFEVGDQARRQTFNVKVGVNENFKNEYYWRLVVAVGEDYIDLSKSDCDAGSTVPQAGDEIVQLGNRNSLNRQGAIVLAAHGEGSPYLKIYTGINSYNLAGKEKVTLSPSIVDIIADNIRFSTGESVKDYIEGMMQDTWVEGKIYNAGTTLPFANCLVKAKNQTTSPPFQLLADDDGNYLVDAATGNYIVYCNAQGKPVLTPDWLIIQDNNDLIDEVKTYTDSLFSITKEEIASKVSQETYAVDKEGMLTRLSSAESSITQQAESIELRVTKTEYETGLSDTERANKAYAEAQALLAEVQAKAYADGVVSSSEAAVTAAYKLYTDAAKQAAIVAADAAADGKITESESILTAAYTAAANAAKQAAIVTSNAYADGVVDEEEKRAIADATAKANAAQTAAQNYATAQANLAKTTAEAYADGIVTEEEKRAIADATAKANAAKDAAIASAAKDATDKANGAISSSKTYTDAQILLTDSKIDLKVSKTEMAAYADWEEGKVYNYPNMVYFANVLFQAQNTTTLPPYRLLGASNGNYLKNATTGDYIAVCNSQGKAVVNAGWKAIIDNNEIIQEGKTYTDAQILLTDNKIALKVSQADYLVDKAGQELEAAKLRATGIDIELKKVTLTANTFLIQDNSGNPIAIFEIGTDGKPRLKANCINANELVTNRSICTDSDGNIVSAMNREGDGAYRCYHSNGKVQLEFVPSKDNGYIASYNSTGLLNWKIGAGAQFLTSSIDSYHEIYLYETDSVGSTIQNIHSLVGVKYKRFAASQGSTNAAYQGVTMLGTYPDNTLPANITTAMKIKNGYYTWQGPPMQHPSTTDRDKFMYMRTIVQYMNGYVVSEFDLIYDYTGIEV
ncbi:MAG: hypothetical protein ACRC3Z_11235 [Phocaeicola sp.]